MYCPDISPSHVFVFPSSNRRRSTYYTASVLVLPNVEMRIRLKYCRQLIQLKPFRWFGMGTNCLELGLPADKEPDQLHCFIRISRETPRPKPPKIPTRTALPPGTLVIPILSRIVSQLDLSLRK